MRFGILNSNGLKVLAAFSRGVLLIFILASCLFFSISANGGQPVSSDRILFLTSYSTAYEWTREAADGFCDYFMRKSPRVGVDVVELDSLLNIGQRMPSSDYRWIFEKLKSNQYKILVVADLPALKVVKQNIAMIPPGVSLFFCGGIHSESVKEIPYRNKSGFLRSLNAFRNMELGLKQFPKTEEIAVITAAGVEGKDIHGRLMLKGFSKNVRLRLLSGNELSTAEMLEQVAALPQNSFVVFSNWKSAVQEDFQSFQTIVANIVERSPGPLYTTVDAYLNLGFLGGMMTNPRTHGREAAIRCDKILSGASAADIPVEIDTPVLKFNWPQFSKFSLSPASVPGAEFIDRPPDWFAVNRDWLFFSGGMLIALFVLIYFLYRERRRERTVKAIYDAMPLRIIVCDANAKIHFHLGERGFKPKSIEEIQQITGVDFRSAIRDVLSLGEHKMLEFNLDNRRRRAVAMRLPKRIFGVETAMWISMDITELAQSRDRLLMNDEFLRNTVALANIEYFHFAEDTMTSSIRCGKYWREENGMPIPAKDWLMAEDLENFLSAWRDLLSGKTQSLRVTYRAGEKGALHDYVMWAQQYKNADCAADAPKHFVGMIQDITELQTSIRDNQDTVSLLNTILENFPNAVVIKNISDHFRWLMVNGNFCRLLNREPSELIGKTNAEIFSDRKDADQISDADSKTAREGSSVQLENSFHDRNGVEYFVVSNRSIVTRADGSKLLVTVITDISELKHAQRVAEETNQVLRTILDNIHAGVTVKDPDSDFRYKIWNKWFSDKMGIPADAVLGKKDDEISFSPEIRERICTEDQEACENGIFSGIVEYADSSNTFSVLDITKKLLTLPWGKRLLVTTLHDLSHERKLAREHEQMITQLTHYVEYERILNRCLQAITLQTDLEESIELLLREIGETTHADRCYIFKFADDDIHVSYAHEWHNPEIPSQGDSLQNIDIREYPGFHARLLKKEDIVIGDLSKEIPDDLAQFLNFLHLHRIRSVLVSGIWVNGRLWGYFEIDFVKTSRAIAPSDIHIIRNAVNLFLLARERELRINELADSVSVQSQIFDNISIPILLTDTDYNIVKTNRAIEQYAKTFSCPENAKKCYSRFCVNGKPLENCPVKTVLKTGKACSIERVFGSSYMQINAQPIFDRSGKMIYVLESGFDITELRRQQEQLAVYLNQEQVISACLRNLVLVQDFNEVLKNIIQLLGKQMGAVVSAVFRYDPVRESLVNVQKWEPSGEFSKNNLQEEITKNNFPECFRVLQSGENLLADLRNRQSNPEQFELYPYLEMRGMQAIACTGIFFRNQFWGQIGMEFLSIEQQFGDMEMRLLTASARIIEVLLERETLYAKLLKSENEKNMIWELMPVPLVLFDSRRNILRVNPAMERLSGLSAAEIVSNSCDVTLCGKSVPESRCPVTLTVQTRQPQHLEMALYGREFEISTLPVFENDTLVRILQIYIDITENNANKRKLIRAVDAAEAAARAKSTFLATMSHEIRTPLNAVIGFSELLQGGEMEQEEQLEYLRAINFAGNALLQLINDILDLSKLESGQMEIACEEADLRNLCEEMMSIFSLRAKEKKLDLRLDYPGNIPLLYFSALRLRQVLLNLIGNSIKFTSEGFVELSICFRIANDETGSLKIEVRDSGMGIRDEFKKSIFHPFIQQRSVRGNQEGSGLGLAISKRLVEYMGGSLSFESTFGKGTVFTILLPEIRYCRTPGSIASGSNMQKNVKERKILLVDDVPLNLMVLQAMLKKFHAETQTASSGAEALEKLKTFQPDLILTDMWMPEMNGAELAEKIRSIPACAALPIFAVTADAENSGSFPMKFFDGILLKPVSIEKLNRLFQAADHVDSHGNGSYITI